MRKLLFSDQSGVAMVMVLAVSTLLLVLSVGFIDTVVRETSTSSRAVKRDASYQAAEAAIDRYIAKLMEDPQYELHYVDPAESTRRTSAGALVSAGSACDAVTGALGWNGGVAWTYPNGKDHWCQLANGYDYNLQIAAPTKAVPAVTIIATGRPHLDSNVANWRTIEARIHPSVISDFQMIANEDITYGSDATTTGKIYAGIDVSGDKKTVTHQGTATADIFGEGNVTVGSGTLTGGAKTYIGSAIRPLIPIPINFNLFLGSLVKVKTAAQNNGGLFLSNSSMDGWAITFMSNGTVQVQSCKRKTQDISLEAPTCSAAVSYAVPAIGAIYSDQSVIVSGQVSGRVTVASNDDVVISNNISYVQPGIDVLGLVAANDVIVAQWVPFNLTWYAATIAQSGQYRSASTSESRGLMTFNGSTATARGGHMSMFNDRVYNYDSNLLFNPPPWFPSIGDAYTILLQRELPASAS